MHIVFRFILPYTVFIGCYFLKKGDVGMTVKKIWMPPTSGRKNRYAVTTLGSILGIALLMLLLIAGGITLSFALSLPRK